VTSIDGAPTGVVGPSFAGAIGLGRPGVKVKRQTWFCTPPDT
jgi:hypothetical protein